jgi:tocopherol O-methyltransferase
MIGALDETAADRVAEHYDDLDELYRDLWGAHIHHGMWLAGTETVEEATQNLVRFVCLRARIGRGARIVDVGCGYGETSRMLVRDLDARVTALTISEKQIARCAPIENPRFMLVDWLRNRLEGASADVVLAIESTEHMADFSLFFSEAARVLEPNGRLVVCAWLSADDVPALAERHLLAPICAEGHMCLRTEHEYERAFRDAGFSLQSFDDVSALVRRTFTRCITRGLERLFLDPRYRAFLTGASNHRVFAKTLFRIRAAYAVRAMRYGVFVATKRT